MRKNILLAPILVFSILAMIQSTVFAQCDTIAPSGTTLVCASSSTTFLLQDDMGATGCGSGSYSWTINSITPGSTISGMANASTVLINVGSTGTFALQCVIDPPGMGGDNAYTVGPDTFSIVASPTGTLVVTDNSGATNDATICVGGTATMTASGGGAGGSYTWSDGLPNGQVQMVSPPATESYTVTIANAAGCTTQKTQIITVSPNPTAAISVTDNSGATNDATICTGGSATMTASGGTSYAWSNGLGTGAMKTVMPTMTTTYTVTVTNASGCTSTASQQIMVSAGPSGSISVTDNSGATNDATICSGGTAFMTASGGLTYVWSDGLGILPIAAPAMPTSTKTYSVTISNVLGCPTVVTQQIIVAPDPTASISVTDNSGATNDATICVGGTATMTASGAGGGGTYAWSNGLGAGATKNVMPTMTTTYSVTATNSFSCTDVEMQQITVAANPTASISVTDNSGATNDATICVGGTATMTASGGGTYVWSDGLGTGAVKMVSPPATKTYTVTVTNASGCTAVAMTQIIVASSPTAAINVTDDSGNANDNIICLGGEATMTASGGTTYAWSGGLGMGAVKMVSPIADITYTVTVTNAAGCTDTESTMIEVDPLPSAEAGQDLQVCAGQSVSVTGASAQNGTIAWTENGMGTMSNPGSINTSYNSSLLDAGNTVTLTLTVTSNNAGCAGETDVSTAVVTVNSLPALVFNSEECADDLSTYSIGGTSTNTDDLSLTSGSGNVNLLGNGNFTISNIPNGTSITILATNDEGCSTTLMYGPVSCECMGEFIPNPPVSGGNKSVCFGKPNPALTVTVGPDETANWFSNPTGGSPLPNGSGTLSYTPTNTAPGVYTYYAETENELSGCLSLSRTPVVLTINALPNAEITGSTAVCEGANTSFSVPNQAGSMYSWLRPNGSTGSSSSININNANPDTDAGTYSVTVTSSAGCTSTNSIELSVTDKPTITITGGGTYCSADNAPNVIITLVGTPPFMFTYNNGNGTDVPVTTNTSPFIITNPVPGNYSIVSFQDAGCTGDLPVPNSINVIENESPQPAINKSEDFICTGGTLMLSADQPYSSYNWSGPGIVGSASGNSININQIGLYTLNVIQNGCPGTTNINIQLSTIVANISLNPADQNGICLGSNVNLQAVLNGGMNTGSIESYNWGAPINANGAAQSDSPTMNPTNYSVTLTNEYGCTDDFNFNLIVHTPVQPILDASNFNNCEGDEITISIENAPFQALEWSIEGAETPNSIKFLANAGVDEVELQTIDANDCFGMESIGPFITYANPTIDASEIEVQVQATEAYSVDAIDLDVDPACDGSITYNWYLVDEEGELPTASDIVQSGPNPNFTTNAPNTPNILQYLYLEVVDDCNCNNQEFVLILINVLDNGACKGKMDGFDNKKYCVGEVGVFTATSEQGSPGNIFQSVNWSIDGQFINSTSDTGPGWEIEKVVKGNPGEPDEGQGELSVKFLIAGDYDIRWHYNYAPCESSTKVTMEVNNNPVIIPGTYDDIICYGSDIEIPFSGFPQSGGSYNYVLKYNTNGGADQDKLFTSSTQKVLKILDAIDDITINLINVSHTQTGCQTDLTDVLEIDVLDPLTVNLIDTCSATLDSISYEFTFEGGDPPYSLSYFTSQGEQITVDTITSTYIMPFDLNGQFVFNYESNCNEGVQESKDIECITCPEIEEIFSPADLQPYLQNSICSNVPLEISFSDLNLETDKFTIVPVLQENGTDVVYSDDNILNFGDFNLTDFSFTIDYEQIEGLVEPGETYFLVFYALPKTSNGFREEACLGTRVNVVFTLAPEPEIEASEQDLIVCKNQNDVLLTANTKVDWDTLNAFNGSFDQYFTDDMYVSFENVNHGEIVVFEAIQTLNGCVGKDTISISVSSDVNDVAPPKDSIFYWKGDILVYNNNGLDLCYQWGKNDQVIDGQTGRYFIYEEAFPLEIMAPDVDIFWVDVSFAEGSDCNDCVNRVYFNSLGPPKLSYKPQQNYTFSFYPNPAHNEIRYKINGEQGGQFKIEFLDITGKQFQQVEIFKENINIESSIDISNMPSGAYFIKISDEGGNVVINKLIKS